MWFRTSIQAVQDINLDSSERSEFHRFDINDEEKNLGKKPSSKSKNSFELAVGTHLFILPRDRRENKKAQKERESNPR